MKTYTETNFFRAVNEIFNIISKEISDDFNDTVRAIVAGGAAVHFYTGARMSHDLDAEFSHRMILPNDLTVIFRDDDQEERELIFDTNYTPVLGLMHEDYIKDSIFVEKINKIMINVLSPVDLAVSKLSRYADNDKADIEALAKEGLFTSEELKKRANEAIDFYIGATGMVKINISEAVEVVQRIEEDLNESNSPR